MSFSDILIFLLKRKKYSIGIPFLAGVLGFAIAWIVPPYYKSEIRIFLDTGSKVTDINSLMKGTAASGILGSFGTSLGSMASQENEDLYLDIIDGRNVMLAAIEEFRLDTVYKNVKYKESLIKLFHKDIKINIDELTGIISCEYEAKNKELARDIVRFMVKEANTKYVKLRQERALQTIEQLRTFRQSIVTSADSLSEALVKFYRSNNLLNLEAQLELTISALSGYEEQIKNMKISESNIGTDNSTAAELRKKRLILEKEFKKLRGEFSEDYLPNKNSVYINSDWAVEKIIEQQKLEADLRRIFATLEMIESNIVMEESNAAKNMPVIQVVQDAYLADYKSKPKRAIWAAIAVILSFALINGWLIARAIYTGELENENRELLKRIVNSLGL
ncbi:MAG: hypothetical protein FWC26_09610 [Fibromonadales bacterium]|nr:hypothetical protein [Fibromonadales bacterium]